MLGPANCTSVVSLLLEKRFAFFAEEAVWRDEREHNGMLGRERQIDFEQLNEMRMVAV